MTPEQLARRFHETYERLAPEFGYRTREASAKPWDEVPEQNRRLMVATCAEILATQEHRVNYTDTDVDLAAEALRAEVRKHPVQMFFGGAQAFAVDECVQARAVLSALAAAGRDHAAGVAEGRQQAAENLFETLHAAGVYAVRTADGRLYQLGDVAFAVPNTEGSTE